MNTLWLATGSFDPYADGTHSRPFRASNGREFDDIFKAHRENTRFILKPGDYYTRGAWAFPEQNYSLLGANCELLGEHGSEATFLYLDTDLVDRIEDKPAQYFETLIAGKGTDSRICTIAGLTLECDNDSGLPTSGIHTYSSGTTIKDVEVRGITGKWGGIEGFGILLNNSSEESGDDGGHVIFRSRVRVRDTANYCTGIYCGSVARGQLLRPSSVSDCLVTSTSTGTDRAHAAYAANEYVRFTNCDTVGFARFLFCDTGNVGDLDITNCRGDYGYCAIDLPAPVSAQNPISHRRRIRVTDSTFTNKSPSSDHAIFLLVQDGSEGSRQVALEDIDVDGVRVVETGLTDPKQFYVVSIKGLLAERIWVRNSRFVSGATTRGGVWPPTPGTAVDFDLEGLPT